MGERTGPTRTAEAAVLLAAGPPQAAPRADLVVGFDRDEAGDVALRVAADLAARLHAHLAVVHIVSLGDYPIDPDSPDWEQQARLALEEERYRAGRALAGHRFGWTYEARSGSPVDVLLAVAEERDALLIVVGRHGAGVSEGLRRLIDGSVSARLVRHCPRPVLVVPAAAGTRAGTTC